MNSGYLVLMITRTHMYGDANFRDTGQTQRNIEMKQRATINNTSITQKRGEQGVSQSLTSRHAGLQPLVEISTNRLSEEAEFSSAERELLSVI